MVQTNLILPYFSTGAVSDGEEIIIHFDTESINGRMLYGDGSWKKTTILDTAGIAFSIFTFIWSLWRNIAARYLTAMP